MTLMARRRKPSYSKGFICVQTLSRVPLGPVQAALSGRRPLLCQSIPLQFHLAALCLLLIVPTLAFAGALVWSHQRGEEQHFQDAILDLSHDVALSLDYTL